VGEFQLFLDLKLHDIPNTVAQAVTAVAKIEPRFLTVHAGGGSKMIAAAAMAAPEIDITAVTVLTSLGADDLAELGISASPLAQAVKLAELSVAAGAKAIVCSPLEVAAIRTAVGASPIIITPGVRPAGDSLGDQVRVMTPKDAIAAGSSLLVIGRPITSLESSAAMTAKAAAILEEIHG
jgi:orotidine-5'-phosphate decarboxylase